MYLFSMFNDWCFIMSIVHVFRWYNICYIVSIIIEVNFYSMKRSITLNHNTNKLEYTISQ